MISDKTITSTEGRSFTSNHVKLLKHMDRLIDIQQKKAIRPVMLHVSPINACNLTCSFCCFANRDLTERLTLNQMKECIYQFHQIGLSGVEFTGGGEPTLHPQFNQIVEYCYSLGLKVGVCTNGAKLDKITNWEHFSWVRLGMYGFYEGYDYHLDRLREKNVKISAAYVWDEAWVTSENPNITGDWVSDKKKKRSKYFQESGKFFEMLSWVEKEKIPTRIAFNAIKDVNIVKKDIETIREQIEEFEKFNGKLKFAFLSDFNFKGERRNDHCYMHMVKPFLFTDGNVYACPSAELSPENLTNVNEQFKVCNWNEVTEKYSDIVGSGTGYKRNHACVFCKYAMQNELIDDVLIETEHNEFA
jgi:MoaA/NifB/PqqE/SkfB family radical SAM enzyme